MQTLNKTELLTRLQEASQVSQDYIAASPQWVQIWVLVMTVVLLPSFLFAFKRTEARWIAMSLLQIAVFTPMLIFTAGASKFWGITHLLFAGVTTEVGGRAPQAPRLLLLLLASPRHA